MPTLNWIGKDSVTKHHLQVPFRLQTSTDWFYPDFLCQLTDGRILVVEFKGEHLWKDAEEKRLVGSIWESRSGGKCVFIMPKGSDLAAIASKIK
jgi:type III restriction enzyme